MAGVYHYKNKQTGEAITFQWNSIRKPTTADISEMFRQQGLQKIESQNAQTKREITPYQTFARRNPTVSRGLTLVNEAAKGAMEGLKDMLTSPFTAPYEAAKSIGEDPFPTNIYTQAGRAARAVGFPVGPIPLGLEEVESEIPPLIKPSSTLEQRSRSLGQIGGPALVLGRLGKVFGGKPAAQEVAPSEALVRVKPPKGELPIIDVSWEDAPKGALPPVRGLLPSSPLEVVPRTALAPAAPIAPRTSRVTPKALPEAPPVMSEDLSIPQEPVFIDELAPGWKPIIPQEQMDTTDPNFVTEHPTLAKALETLAPKETPRETPIVSQAPSPLANLPDEDLQAAADMGDETAQEELARRDDSYNVAEETDARWTARRAESAWKQQEDQRMGIVQPPLEGIAEIGTPEEEAYFRTHGNIIGNIGDASIGYENVPYEGVKNSIEEAKRIYSLEGRSGVEQVQDELPPEVTPQNLEQHVLDTWGRTPETSEAPEAIGKVGAPEEFRTGEVLGPKEVPTRAVPSELTPKLQVESQELFDVLYPSGGKIREELRQSEPIVNVKEVSANTSIELPPTQPVGAYFRHAMLKTPDGRWLKGPSGSFDYEDIPEGLTGRKNRLPPGHTLYLLDNDYGTNRPKVVTIFRGEPLEEGKLPQVAAPPNSLTPELLDKLAKEHPEYVGNIAQSLGLSGRGEIPELVKSIKKKLFLTAPQNLPTEIGGVKVPPGMEAPQSLKEGDEVIFETVPVGSYLKPGTVYFIEGVGKDIHFRNPKTGGATYDSARSVKRTKYHVVTKLPPGPEPVSPEAFAREAVREAKASKLKAKRKKLGVSEEDIVDEVQQETERAKAFREGLRKAKEKSPFRKKLEELHKDETGAMDVQPMLDWFNKLRGRKAKQKAAKDILQKAPEDAPVRQFFKDYLTTSSQTMIEKLGGTQGEEISRLLSRSRLKGESYAGEAIADYRLATKNLTDEEFGSTPNPPRGNLIDVLDKGDTPMNSKVEDASDIIWDLLNTEGERAEQSGMGLRTPSGAKIPFQRREFYYPHIYPKEWFEKIRVDPSARAEAIKDLMGEGNTRQQAEDMLKRGRRYGEKLVSAQHGRESNRAGWRRDRTALEKHFIEMGGRTSKAEELGPMDLAGSAKEPLGKLLEELENNKVDTTEIRKYLRRILDRDEHPEAWKYAFSNKVAGAMTWMHLSNFAISNMNQLAVIPLRGNFKSFGKELAKSLFQAKQSKESGLRTGATIAVINHEILHEYGRNSGASKAFWMKGSEEWQRSIASGVGRGSAKVWFDSLKKNPTNTRVRRLLKDLILEEPDTTKASLTPKQLSIAGNRMSEQTQGRAGPQDIPYAWSNSPLAGLYWLYRKYAFRSTKIIWDALKSNPARNIPVALALFQLFGELTGDVKKGIKGSIKGGVEGAIKEVEERGKWVGTKNPILNRITENYLQSWALGLAGDMMESFRKGQGSTLGFLAGVPGQVAAEFIGGTSSAIKGKGRPLAKSALRRVPYVGSGLAERVFPKKLPAVGVPAY